MRRILKLAAAVPALALVVLGLGPAPASAHSYKHDIGISGSMWLFDHESWGSNESGWHHFNSGVVVGGPVYQNQYFTGGCAGNEVRGELRVTIIDNSQYPGYVYAWIDAKLYEGASCSSGDLDGHRTFGGWIAKGQTRNWAFRVDNTDEGGDLVDYNFKVSNSTY